MDRLHEQIQSDGSGLVFPRYFQGGVPGAVPHFKQIVFQSS